MDAPLIPIDVFAARVREVLAMAEAQCAGSPEVLLTTERTWWETLQVLSTAYFPPLAAPPETIQ